MKEWEKKQQRCVVVYRDGRMKTVQNSGSTSSHSIRTCIREPLQHHSTNISNRDHLIDYLCENQAIVFLHLFWLMVDTQVEGKANHFIDTQGLI